MTAGKCCDPSASSGSSDACDSSWQFCSTSSAIKNEVLQQFTCPASQAWCPSGFSDINIEVAEEGTIYTKEYDWKREVPYDDAIHLRCKYAIRTSTNLPSRSSGYLYVEIENYGYEEDIFVIVQPVG